MAQGQKVFRRIRHIKHSLENAEQSFLDNKGIRGELDLMLAEAELSNLRRKKDVPWNWNRQLLALCIAVMLGLSGFGGWYYAVHYAEADIADQSAVVRPQEVSTAAAVTDDKKAVNSAETADTDDNLHTQVQTAKAAEAVNKNITQNISSQQHVHQVMVSEADMRRLIKSARTELTSSN